MDVAYPRLSNGLCSGHSTASTQRTSAFSAVRVSDALFPNDLGEDLL